MWQHSYEELCELFITTKIAGKSNLFLHFKNLISQIISYNCSLNIIEEQIYKIISQF